MLESKGGLILQVGQSEIRNSEISPRYLSRKYPKI